MSNGKKVLDEMVNAAVEEGAFPGACYAVVTKKKVTYGFGGYRELYPMKVKNTLDTIYDMASVTKVVCTTTCIMQLLENGKLRLFDNVKRYIPEFKHENISLWHLLTHTSGFPEGVPLSVRDNPLTCWNYIYNVEILYTPGSKISYSDINYILLGKIVENLSGEKLNVYANNHIFKPLKMRTTGFNPLTEFPNMSEKDMKKIVFPLVAATEKDENDSYVKGFVHDETARALGGVAGHAGLFSTVNDIAIFIQMILNEGSLNGAKILSKQTVDLLFEKQVEDKTGSQCHGTARALGWQVKDPGSSAGELISDQTILHTGFTGTNLFIDRKNEIGFVMLSNRVHPTRQNLKHLHWRACMANYIISHQEEFK